MPLLEAPFACFLFLDGLGNMVEVRANKNPGYRNEKDLECIMLSEQAGHQSVASYPLAASARTEDISTPLSLTLLPYELLYQIYP